MTSQSTSVMGQPIFVRGLSRSGGTLVVTLLDSHPAIAMSYELYPSLLLTDDVQDFSWRDLLSKVDVYRDFKSLANSIDEKGVRTFLSRCPRGGLSLSDFQGILQGYFEKGLEFNSTKNCLLFIEQCCLHKMQSERKERWGLKCSNQLEEYHNLWPDACFINVIRDGRDVLASQLKLGTFNRSPRDLGRSWSRTHHRFRKFAEQSGANALEIFYEKLVSSPEQELEKMCQFLGVEFDLSMTDFYKEDLTIYKTNHLSLQQISRPINSYKVGRWKTDLSDHQLQEFYESAESALCEFGYSL